MARAARVFRIEQRGHQTTGDAENDAPVVHEVPLLAEQRHAEIMSALNELKSHRTGSVDDDIAARTDSARAILENLRAEISEASELKKELDSIYEAIAQTKKEIVTLHESGFQGEEMSRVTDELDAIVMGTESATDAILSGAEIIDERSSDLSAKLSGDDNAMASDIQDQVMKIYEACNFQDLTGQRITKVVNTLKFIEDRVVRMMEIWGGIEGLSDIDPDTLPPREGDAALLNGPALDTDLDVASQDDIDALFA